MKQYFQHSCLNNWLFGTLFVSIWTNKLYVIFNIEINFNVAELRNSANDLWNSATRCVEFCNKMCGILQSDLRNSAISQEKLVYQIIWKITVEYYVSDFGFEFVQEILIPSLQS